MNILSVIMAFFSVLGALDCIFGNRLRLGREFERGFMLLGTMSLSMIGMIVISPFLAEILKPLLDFTANTLKIDPSIIPASLFANDMGGAPLSLQVASNEQLGKFNGLVVSSMMGCTVSYTIPLSLGMVKKEQHNELLLGLLCGVVTIPVGCFFAGLVCGLPILTLLVDIIPLVLFAVVVTLGLLVNPKLCVKLFSILGYFIKALIIFGLTLGIIKYLTGNEIIKNLATIEEGALICINASVVISGAFPLIHIVSRLLKKPIGMLGKKLKINDISAMGIFSTIATSTTTFEMMNSMDKKGTMLNSAFAVSAAFTFAGHLAFTMAYDADYIPAMIVGKLTAGVLSVLLAEIIYRRTNSSRPAI